MCILLHAVSDMQATATMIKLIARIMVALRSTRPWVSSTALHGVRHA